MQAHRHDLLRSVKVLQLHLCHLVLVRWKRPEAAAWAVFMAVLRAAHMKHIFQQLFYLPFLPPTLILPKVFLQPSTSLSAGVPVATGVENKHRIMQAASTNISENESVNSRVIPVQQVQLQN